MFENEHFRTFVADGIVFIEYKTEEPLTLEMVTIAVRERLKIAKNLMMPIFIDFRKPRGATKEAKIYLSNEGMEGLTAGAMLINNAIGMIAFNFYMKFDTPPRPMKSFVHKEKALQWLNQFKTAQLN